ncbi:Gfo/Idh/MocA family protein [Chloroflexota bacterium]
MPIGWGIIGTGNHANNVTAPALNKAANGKLVAVCDLNEERAKEFATKHGVERTYDSLDKMLEDPELDVLYIATPNKLHAPQTIQAAEAGKHVLCEKPMALTVSDAEEMISISHKNKVKLGVSFPGRYHPVQQEARRYIQSGIAGEIYLAKAQYCRGGSRVSSSGWRGDPKIAGAGALYGTALHPIDILRFILDSEVAEVRALTDEEPPRYPVDNMVYVIMKFENGVTGVVISGTLAHRSDNDALVYGSKAKIICKGTIGSSVLGNLGEFQVDGDAINVRAEFPTDDYRPYTMIREVDAFNKWIEDDTEPSVTSHNGLQMVRISNAILESSRQGKAVKIEKG